MSSPKRDSLWLPCLQLPSANLSYSLFHYAIKLLKHLEWGGWKNGKATTSLFSKDGEVKKENYTLAGKEKKEQKWKSKI